MDGLPENVLTIADSVAVPPEKRAGIRAQFGSAREYCCSELLRNVKRSVFDFRAVTMGWRSDFPTQSLFPQLPDICVPSVAEVLTNPAVWQSLPHQHLVTAPPCPTVAVDSAALQHRRGRLLSPFAANE